MSKIKVTYTPEQLAFIEKEKQLRKLASRAKRKEFKKSIGLSGWKLFTGEQLPPQACVQKSEHEPNGHNIFKYSGCWIEGYTYYKGDNPETAVDWIVTVDNGGFYKVGAIFMTWRIGPWSNDGSQCTWSLAALKRSMKSLLTSGQTVRDPGYTT